MKRRHLCLPFLRYLPLLIFLALPAAQVRGAGVVGDGTPGSCTESALTSALNGGGLVTFDCGGDRKSVV